MEPSVSKSANEALNSDFFYGWDLLFKTVDGKLDKKADILIVLAHFLLTKHYKFRCIGIGDDVSSNCFSTMSKAMYRRNFIKMQFTPITFDINIISCAL